MAEGALQKYKFLRFDGSKRFMAGVDTRNNSFEDNLQDVKDAAEYLLDRVYDENLDDEAYYTADKLENINSLGREVSDMLRDTIPETDPDSGISSINDILSQASTKLEREGKNPAVSYLTNEIGADEAEVGEAISAREEYLEVERKIRCLRKKFRDALGSFATVDEGELRDGEPGTLGFKRWVQKASD